MNHPTYHKILVPLDCSDLAERALPRAVETARQHDAEVILLTAIRPSMSSYTDQMTLAGVTGISDQIRPDAESYLKGLRYQLRKEGVKTDCVIVESHDPARAICQVARQEAVDLVVMSSHERKGLARLLHGSVAHQIMRRLNVPVMLVRPERTEVREQAIA